MAKYLGKGYTLEVSVNNSTWTSIPNMTSLTMPTISKDSIETTTHANSGYRNFTGGLVDSGEVVFTSQSELYTAGEGYGNWNPKLADGTRSQNRSSISLDGNTYTTATADTLTAVHMEKDYISAFPYEERNINGTFRNTRVSNGGTGILRSDVAGAYKGTGWTTDGSSTNAGISIDHTTSPKKLVVDTSADENPPYAYMNKSHIAKSSGFGHTGERVFPTKGVKHQFNYTVHSFSPASAERFLILNYNKMSRYNRINISRNSQGNQYYDHVTYPDVPYSENDIYVYTGVEDRFDRLALQYYNDSSLWWAISAANPNLKQDSYYPPIGIQIRIPSNVGNIVKNFERFN